MAFFCVYFKELNCYKRPIFEKRDIFHLRILFFFGELFTTSRVAG